MSKNEKSYPRFCPTWGIEKSWILQNDHFDSLRKSYIKISLPLLRLLPLLDSDTLMKEGGRQGSGGEGGG